MDELGQLRENFREIERDWSNAPLREQENYIVELHELADQVSEIQGIEATKLFQEVRTLWEHIQTVILPAEREHDLDLRSRDDELPGAKM